MDSSIVGQRRRVELQNAAAVYFTEELMLLRQAAMLRTNMQAVFALTQIAREAQRDTTIAAMLTVLRASSAAADDQPAHRSVMRSLCVSRTARVMALLGAVVGLVCAVPALAHAQGTGGGAGPAPGLDEIIDVYHNAALGWRVQLVPIAQRIFMLLAALEFCISGLVWAVKRESLDDLAAKFLLKFTLIAFLLTLITSFTTWVMPIYDGFVWRGSWLPGAPFRPTGSSMSAARWRGRS